MGNGSLNGDRGSRIGEEKVEKTRGARGMGQQESSRRSGIAFGVGGGNPQKEDFQGGGASPNKTEGPRATSRLGSCNVSTSTKGKNGRNFAETRTHCL